jgi:hypothetical protein
MIDTLKYFIQQLLLVVLVIGGLLLLWEIPHYEGNALSHKDQVLQLGNHLPPYEIKTFLKHITTRLPYYRDEFQQAEEKTGIPWVLLASMSYQESKWNRHAISPTGVRGLMMLTRSTAADLGIQNRLDPMQGVLVTYPICINGCPMSFKRQTGCIWPWLLIMLELGM